MVAKMSRGTFTTSKDYVGLINSVAIAKRQGLQSSTKTVLKNYRFNASKRNRHLLSAIQNAFDMFVDLDAQAIFTKYIIWWTSTVYDQKLASKYTEIDVVNDKLLDMFTDWLAIYINNISILNEFNKMCKFIASKCVNGKKAEDVLRHLINIDHWSFSAAHMSGDISMHALATIPDNVIKTFDLTKSQFSKNIFDNVLGTREYLLGALNLAFANIIKTPVDFISYVNNIYLFKVKQ